MGAQAITVRIAGKSYPMTVESTQEEEVIRKAERQIRDSLRAFEEKYAVSDMRDLLSMCLLQFATEAVEVGESNGETEQRTQDRLKALEQELDAALGQ